MITDRDELESILEKMISAYAKDRKVIRKVTKELNNRNVLDGDILSIFKLNTPISSLSLSFLYCFTEALFDAIQEFYGKQEHRIDPVKHFTPLEIETAEKWSQEIVTEDDKYPVVFQPVIRIQNGWLTAMSIKDINNLFSRRILTYNPETQRPLKRKEVNDQIIERIDINPKSVTKIKNLFLNDDFLSNCITINVLEDSDVQLEYDPSSSSVSIYSGSINLTDGYHRYRGMAKALLENPDLEFIQGIILTHFDVEKALKFIHQEQQHNPIDKKFTKTINPSNMSNNVVTKINEKNDSMLRGKITKDPIMLKTGKSLILYSVLADVINLTFNPIDTKDMLKVSYAVISGLNSIIESNPKLLDKSVDFKYWVVYICLIFSVYSGKFEEDAEDIIEKILPQINIDQIEIKAINKSSIRHINNMLSSLMLNLAKRKDEDNE